MIDRLMQEMAAYILLLKEYNASPHKEDVRNALADNGREIAAQLSELMDNLDDHDRMADIKNFILTQWPKMETLGKNDQHLVNYHIGILKKDFGITTIIGDNSVMFREGKL